MAERAKAARRERRRVELERRRTQGRHAPRAAWVLRVLAIAFLVSGGAGLIHEVVWSRLLGHLFGATSLAISTVLAAFMAGLALGSYWIGTRSGRFADRRRAYAWLEIGIGVLALLVPLLLDVVEPVYGWLWRRFHFSFAVFGMLRFAVAGAILIGPTIMMGATLPVLAGYTAALQGRRLAPEWLYTLNLAGAVLGVVAGGFVLMPSIGVWGTIIAGASLNLLVGATVLGLPAVDEQRVPAHAGGLGTVPRVEPLLLAAAFLSGLTSLATQIAWTRVLVLVVGSTTYAFSSVLLVYLVALGVGSAYASRRARRVAKLGADLAMAHALMGVCLLGTLYAVNRLPYWYLELYHAWRPATLAGIVALPAAIACAVLAWPVLCAGTILPLVLAAAHPADPAGTAPVVGRIYAVNTVGAILGATLGGFVLIPLFGSQALLLGVAALATAMGCVFALRRPRPPWLPGFAVAAAALVAAGILARPRWNYLELQAGVFEPGRIYDPHPKTLTNPGERVLYAREGPTASVLVSLQHGGERALLINGRSNASDAPDDMSTQVLLAQLPILLAPRTDDVFVVGWGSGVTVGSALASPARRVTAAEIEPAVVEASRLFLHVNHDPLADPRLRLYADDARHILLAADERYDVIVSEPPHPWVTGVANIFTRDFYRLADRRLRPDGVFSQWLQTYELSLASFRAILAAFQSVFPEVLIFHLGSSLDTILVGSHAPIRVDLQALERRCRRPETARELRRVGLKSPEDLLARFLLDAAAVRSMVKDAPVNTDDNMYVELNGPKDMVLPQGAANERTSAALEQHAVPVESILGDRDELLASRRRLRLLVRALARLGRPSARYERLRRTAALGEYRSAAVRITNKLFED